MFSRERLGGSDDARTDVAFFTSHAGVGCQMAARLCIQYVGIRSDNALCYM